MKANLSQREPKMLEHWQTIGLYQKIRQQNKDQPKFILHDGPPYANGDIHIGHAVNKILKDIIVKSKTLSGFDAPYVPGWDCHGLPIELNVEKKIGKPGVKVNADEFRQACRQYAGQQVDKQRADFIRLGVFGDWNNPYLTMDYLFEADTVRALGRIIANGHLHKGYKPVHWCLECGSALAEAEVEHEDKVSPQIDVRFQVCDAAAIKNIFNTEISTPVSIPIWTTTPWTLPANQAVALHPELEYVLVDTGEEHIIMAEALLESGMQRYGIESYKTLATTQGKALEGIELKHPFYDRQVAVIVGEHVTTEAGTGAVHTAPGHGQEDYAVGLKYELPVYNPVDGRGVFLPDTELLAGMHVNKANDFIIELMQNNNTLLHTGKLQHSYPHCWRHKKPIIFRATPQWFINMTQNQLREHAMAAIQSTQWLPDWGQARIEGMVEKRPDWCISRQRTWGVPITLFIHKETEELHPDTAALIEKVAQRIEENGIDAWHQLDPTELLGAESVNYDKVTDTLDVWFDSGVTHVAVLEQRAEELSAPPVDLYLEGSDQHRGWFQSSLLTSVAMRGHAPYKSVLTHGFTVDAQGRKMSKSMGNVLAPQKVLKTLGADVLRLWVAATDYSAEMNVSDEILKRTADSYRRMRNTIRYFLSNLDGFDPSTDQLPKDELLMLDRWAVNAALHLQEQIIDAYEHYQFHRIYQLIHNFCSVDMGSFYLDIIKDRQYTTQASSRARRSAQTAMYHLAEAMLRWLTPILSFTAEEAWQHMPGDRSESIFMAQWYDGLFELNEKQPFNTEFWKTVLEVRTAVSKQLESLREAGTIGSSLNAEVDLYCDEKLFATLSTLEDELRFILITSYARLHSITDIPTPAETLSLSDGSSVSILVKASEHLKCVRCWHQQEDVGTHTEHPELCGRCVNNVAGEGENRNWA